MSFTPFSAKQFIKEIDTGETPKLGRFKDTRNQELTYIRVDLYIQGTANLGGSEQIRLKIFADADHNVLLYTSSWANLSDIDTIVGTKANWRGQIRIDFNKENINKNLNYYVGAEMANYTRNGETFWVGLAHDFPFPRYATGASDFFDTNLAIELFGES